MKIVLELDEAGNITDSNGYSAGFHPCVQPFEWVEKSDQTDIESIIKLKNAGFDTDEIIELRKKELI